MNKEAFGFMLEIKYRRLKMWKISFEYAYHLTPLSLPYRQKKDKQPMPVALFLCAINNIKQKYFNSIF